MNKIYYHVVTNKPMELGQIISYKDENRSGVYQRVYALLDVVNDIYQNPAKYENLELDHHLKVALRELALEEVRQKKYPNFPSRLESLYVSEILEEALKWYDLFISWGRPTFQIVKVETDGDSFVGDANNCFDGSIDKNLNLELAEMYWMGLNNKREEEPIVEILINGNIKVLEIIKDNKKIK